MSARRAAHADLMWRGRPDLEIVGCALAIVADRERVTVKRHVHQLHDRLPGVAGWLPANSDVLCEETRELLAR